MKRVQTTRRCTSLRRKPLTATSTTNGADDIGIRAGQRAESVDRQSPRERPRERRPSVSSVHSAAPGTAHHLQPRPSSMARSQSFTSLQHYHMKPVQRQGSIGDMSTVMGSNGYGAEATWKKYHNDMVVRMQKDKLREATRKKDRGMLERAVHEADETGLDAPDEIAKARETLAVIEAKDELREAFMSNDSDELRAVIQKVESQGKTYMKHLQHELYEAKVKADCLDRTSRIRGCILTMNTKTMSELRRYHKPPYTIHRVMQAAFMLMGKDEELTADWSYCQKLCKPLGAEGLQRKVLDYDVTSVHPEIAARANEMLADFELKDVQAVSPGAGTFYVWSMGVIEMVEHLHRKGQKYRGLFVPANVRRQQEILSSGQFDGYGVPLSPRQHRKDRLRPIGQNNAIPSPPNRTPRP